MKVRRIALCILMVALCWAVQAADADQPSKGQGIVTIEGVTFSIPGGAAFTAYKNVVSGEQTLALYFSTSMLDVEFQPAQERKKKDSPYFRTTKLACSP